MARSFSFSNDELRVLRWLNENSGWQQIGAVQHAVTASALAIVNGLVEGGYVTVLYPKCAITDTGKAALREADA